jgi:hypothetical protein
MGSSIKDVGNLKDIEVKKMPTWGKGNIGEGGVKNRKRGRRLLWMIPILVKRSIRTNLMKSVVII